MFIQTHQEPEIKVWSSEIIGKYNIYQHDCESNRGNMSSVAPTDISSISIRNATLQNKSIYSHVIKFPAA